MPAATPVTIPVLPTVATLVGMLLQVPPGDISDSDTDAPAHMVSVPDIVAGSGSTVITSVVKQPLPEVKMTVQVPTVCPVTLTVDAPVAPSNTEPVPGWVLHVPPLPSSSTVVLNRHTVELPFIGVGLLLTVTITVA